MLNVARLLLLLLLLLLFLLLLLLLLSLFLLLLSHTVLLCYTMVGLQCTIDVSLQYGNVSEIKFN